MFRSEKLVRITIQVPDPFISATTEILARFKLLHLIRIDETHLGRLGYAAKPDDSLLDELEALFRAIEQFMETLRLRSDGARLTGEVIPETDLYKVRVRLDEMLKEAEGVLREFKRIEPALEAKSALLEKLRLLPEDLDFLRLSGRRFICWAIGLVPTLGLDRLEESLSEVHHALIDLGALEERTVVLVFGLKRDWPVFERALQGALFDPVPLAAELLGPAGEVVVSTQAEIEALEKRAKDLSGEREALQRKFGPELLVLREKIIAARQILLARRYFGKVDSSYLISGWIPERLCETLGAELAQATEGRALLEKVAPEDVREVRAGIVTIPILFNNPLLISPFEKLTSLYGTPRYREVEPTVFFALSFLLLFGMMFGDVGQGGVLFGLGYFVFRRFYKHMDYGIILMECGVSSILFGFLYGTVFGLETLVPALWFRPMDNIPYFAKVTLSLGVALVSLGLALNLVNALRLKEYESLLSASGLAGTLLYWMTAGLALKYLLTGQVAAGELVLLKWAAAVLMAVMIFHRPLARLLIRKEPARSLAKGTGAAGFLTELLESVVELFDDLIRFAASTVSFIRVAAFALSHAALFVAVFSIADLVSHEKGSGLPYWLVVALGNLVIIVLEGMIVSIQTVRLEYYEFFGRFFRGGGERFKPFDRELGVVGKK